MRRLFWSVLAIGFAASAATGVVQVTPPTAEKPAVPHAGRVGTKSLDEWLAEWRAATFERRELLAQSMVDGFDIAPDRAACARIFELLRAPEAWTREAACALLRFDREDAETITPRLEPLLTDPELRVRWRAAATLLNVAYPRPKAAYDVLLELANGDDPELAASALQYLADHARVEPRVLDLLIDRVIYFDRIEDAAVRRAIVSGLAISDEERALEGLRLLLHHADAEVRVTAASNVAAAEPGNDEAAAVLFELLHDPSAPIRRSAVAALAPLGASRSSEVVPMLVAALGDADVHVRTNAAGTLGNLGFQESIEAPDAVPALVELAKSEDVFARAAAAWALGNVGAETQVAVPALALLIQDPFGEARHFALNSLKEAGSDVVLVLPQLITALNDPQPLTRAAVAGLIAQGGAKSADAVDPLAKRLADPVANVRVWAAYALREIGPAAAVALPSLTRRLAEDPEPKVRVEAVRTLAGIGPLAGAAADAVVAACADPELDVRLWSLFALGEIGANGAAAVAALESAAKSADARVLAEANKALARLGRDNDAAAIANAPGEVLKPPTISAYIHYVRLALVFSDAHGAGIVDFLDESGGLEDGTERRGLRYRWRYLAKEQFEATGGESEVHSVAHQRPTGYVYDMPASMTTISAGPLHVDWSYSGPGIGYVYWLPETQRVEIALQEDFETLDLSRFIR